MVSMSSSNQGLGSSRSVMSKLQNSTDISSSLLSDENSTLKRKLEKLGSSNPDLSNKKQLTQVAFENSDKTTLSNSISSLSKTSNSSLSSKSEPSLSSFHRTVFQSYVKTALDDLDNKVCVERCSRIYRNSEKNGRKKLLRKQKEIRVWN